MAENHLPNCPRDHPLGTVCSSSLRARAEQLVVRRQEMKPIIIATAAEDIKAGQTVAIDPATGLMRVHPGEK